MSHMSENDSKKGLRDSDPKKWSAATSCSKMSLVAHVQEMCAWMSGVACCRGLTRKRRVLSLWEAD